MPKAAETIDPTPSYKNEDRIAEKAKRKQDGQDATTDKKKLDVLWAAYVAGRI
ncbi:MAG: hypothetical protein PHV13_02925 [Candidatus ainarchaeum sp.]|nr:hypothetical protein [Candidatus ainarchaeum sp.]